MENLSFCKASITDISDILSIYEQSFDRNKCKDVYLVNLTSHDIKRELQNYYVLKNTERVYAYLKISFTLPSEVYEARSTNHIYRKLLSEKKNKSIYLENLVVEKQYRNKGLGSLVMANFLNLYPDFVIFSFIMTKPNLNEYSIELHKKFDYEQVGLLTITINNGKTFESQLYAKFN